MRKRGKPIWAIFLHSFTRSYYLYDENRTMDMSHVLFVFLIFSASVCNAKVFNKIEKYIAIVGNGEADVQLEDNMIGLRILRESVCSFTLVFQCQHSVIALLVSVEDSNVFVYSEPVNFDGGNFVDIFISSNGSVYRGNEPMRTSLQPLKVDNEKRVHFTSTKITDGCYIPIVKGKVDESQLEESTSSGFPVWAIVIIVIVIVAFIVGGILLAVFHRRLPCFKPKPEAAPEEKPLLEVKVDSKQPEPKPQPEPQPKTPKVPQLPPAAPSAPVRPPPPKPSVSAVPSATETTPTPSAAALPPRTEPAPSEEPPVAPPSKNPPQPAAAPTTSDEPAPRFTARSARVHKSVPQRLLDQPTKTTSRSSERRKRILRKNSLEVGNCPPGYKPPPLPFPKMKVPTPPTEQPGTSAETGKKKECCPEKEPPVPAPAEYRELPPTKRLPQTEYLNWTPSEGSPHPSQETKERVSTEKVSEREAAKRKPEAKVDDKKGKSADGKPSSSKPKRTSSKEKKSSEDKAVNHAVDDEDYKK